MSAYKQLIKAAVVLVSLVMSFSVGSAQERDYAAELPMKAVVTNVGMVPNGDIWMSSRSGMISWLPADSLYWHHIDTVIKFPSTTLGHTVYEVVFFDDSIGVCVGNLRASRNERPGQGYFRTTDAGLTWTQLSFNRDVYVYTSFLDANGVCWIGGLSGDLLRSDDKGLTWHTLETRFDDMKRLYAIYMTPTGSGIIGSGMNALAITSDYGSTFETIPTPNDQLNRSSEEKYVDQRILRVAIVEDHYVVEQLQHVWISPMNSIQWDTLDYDAKMFAHSPTTGCLYTVGSDNKVTQLGSGFQPIKRQPTWLHEVPVVLTCHDSTLMVEDNTNTVTLINNGKVTRVIEPLISTIPITPPRNIIAGANYEWGYTREFVYAREFKERSNWFRVGRISEYPEAIRLINDTTALVWAGGTNFRYALNSDTPTEYSPNAPIQFFLKYPAISLVVESSFVGCYKEKFQQVRYELNTRGDWKQVSTSSEPGMIRFEGGVVSSDNIRSALTHVNETIGHIPVLQEYGITQGDIAEFRDTCKRYSKLIGISIPDPPPTMQFFEKFLSSIDSLTQSNHAPNILYWSGPSRTISHVRITITNGIGDQVIMTSGPQDFAPRPWGLPFTVKYNNSYFNTNSLELARLVKLAMPKNFMYRQHFENWRLLNEIAIDRYWKD